MFMYSNLRLDSAMKKNLLILLSIAIAAATPSAADDAVRQADVKISGSEAAKMVSAIKVERNKGILNVTADISLADQPAGINREIWLQPILTSGDSVLNLPVVAVAGKYRYLHGLRHETYLAPGLTWTERKSRNHTVSYSAQVPYASWMNGAEFSLNVITKGCCGVQEQQSLLPLAQIGFVREVFHPVFNWIAPEEEVKVRELRGQAFIDFPVSKTDILPDYRSNAVELAKIRATIDSVRTDADVTIRSLSIHGYASPEGFYSLNEKLAKGRTEALKRYVDNLYHFAPGIISTEWTGEDWEGLRKWLEASTLPDASAIIAVIDDPSLSADAREWRIKSGFPAAYALLRENVYPSLRHSDYRIEYTVRAFTQIDEIISIAQVRPQNLSLAELFKGAKSQPEGSKLYNDLFETAATVYPDSEIANLNAANIAMQRGDLDSAARYLAKAGDTPQAIYARGNLEALRGNYDAAATLFQQAARLKVADAPAALAQVNKLKND